jgi:hypothetical protein
VAAQGKGRESGGAMSETLICKATDGTWFVFLDIEVYRAAVRRGSPVPPRELGRLAPVSRVRCGTSHGYRLHEDNGERPCQACLDFMADYKGRDRIAYASR